MSQKIVIFTFWAYLVTGYNSVFKNNDVRANVHFVYKCIYLYCICFYFHSTRAPPHSVRSQGIYPAARSLPESGEDTLVQAILNLDRGYEPLHTLYLNQNNLLEFVFFSIFGHLGLV